ncbi:MAG: Ig-like domain-containing protein [Campylobacterota bacterium]|nr:Ig-like domain-containing protein [Campylobacterota bacterium]
MNQIKFLIFTSMILFSILLIGCNSSSKDEKNSNLTLRNLHEVSAVPTNAKLYLEFSKDIDFTTVNDHTFFLLDKNGVKVDGALHVESNLVSFKPANYLDPLVEYTLVVTRALLSTSGYALFQEYQWNFTSSDHTDNKSPILTLKIPENQASIHTEIAFEFDEQIYAHSNQSDLLELKDADNKSVAGVSSLEYDIIRFSPLKTLNFNTGYTVTLKANIADLYNNEYNGTKTWSFTTAKDDVSEPLSSKEVASYDTQTTLLSMTSIDDILLTGTDESINTYRIDRLTCKLSALASFALETPTYVIEPHHSLLLSGSSKGVNLLSVDTQGKLGESINIFYETDAPVYDIAASGNTAFLAQTVQGVQALDISAPSTPLKLFDLPEVMIATELAIGSDYLYVADNFLQELFTFTLDGNLFKRSLSHGNIYDLEYDIKNQALYLAMGLQSNARSFINNVLTISHEKEHKLLSDKNRGITLMDTAGGVHEFITYKKDLFGLVYYESCLFLGFEDGEIRSVDIFAPFVVQSSPKNDAVIETDKQSIVLSFDQKIDAQTLIEENFTFTDERATPIAYTLSFDGEKTVSITPQESLHVKHHYTLHVKSIKDLYNNVMDEPYRLNFTISYMENIAPQANDDTVVMDEDTSLSIAILANDSDVSGDDTLDRSSVVLTTLPAHGSVTLNSLGIAYYTPYANYYGQDSFTYTVSDKEGKVSNSATVTITIDDVYDAPPNQAPQANDDTTIMNEDTSQSIAILANDSDANGDDTLDRSSVVLTTLPAHGSVTLNSLGIAYYTPYANYYGQDSFTYTVSDKEGKVSNSATVTITIDDVYDAPPNQAPVANADTRTFVKSPLYIDILSNDTDINGNVTIDPTTVTITQPISGQGTISLNPTTGVVTYTLAAILTFPETFKYTVKDTSGAISNEALVTINP